MPTPLDKASFEDFHTLGLEPGASIEQVKKAYRELAKRWHPDRFQQQSAQDRKRSEEKFKEITRAYTRISKGLKAGRKAPHQQWAEKYPGGGQGFDDRGEPGVNGAKDRHAAKGRQPGGRDRGVAEAGRSSRVAISVRHILWAAIALVTCGLLLTLVPHSPSPSRKVPPATPPVEAGRYALPSPQADVGDPQQDDIASSRPGSEGAARLSPTPDDSSLREDAGKDTQAPHFTIGSSKAEVLRVQGPPTRVRGQTWIYGLSDVQFREGRVWRYNNFDHSLKVRLLPARTPPPHSPEFFTVGSTRDEVLAVQGTPTRVDGNKWTFGFSEVRFKEGRVEDYDNYFGNLKVRLLPSHPSSTPPRRDYFTIGSTRDEVLAVQGTPTSIQGNFWFYHFSNILFREGKVQHVVNAAGNLHFISPEELARREKAP
ncbi:MAG: J domain-containing protein [Deltaproteobacteria bacterium]|nr:J domain-containing protein [Deltaproteobacteria bacterium]